MEKITSWKSVKNNFMAKGFIFYKVNFFNDVDKSFTR